MAGLLIQMGGLLIHHCCGCRGSPPLVAHSTQHPAHMHHVSFHHIIQYISKVNIVFISLVISHLSSHCQIPPIMNISSYHQLLLISISHPQVESRSRACSLLRRAAPDATDAPAPAAGHGTGVSASRLPTAGGRQIKRLCAHCLCTPLRAMPAAPPLHPLRLSSLENSLPRRHCECEVPSLGRFQPRSDGWVGLVASPLLLRLRTQASPDACGRRLQAGCPREEMIGCSL